MKRLAIFIGGLFMLPAFAEVAPVFYEDGIEYSDVVYDEYGNPILDYEYDDTDLVSDTNENATKPSVSGARVVSGTRSNATNRTTVGRAIPTATTATSSNGRASAANSSRVVAARTTTNSSPRSTSNSRGVASRTTSTTAARTTGSTAATRAAATRATGGSGRATSARTGSAGTGTVARTATTTRTTTGARTANASRVSRAATKLNTVVTTTTIPTENVTVYTDGDPLYIGTNAAADRMGATSAGNRNSARNRASIVASEVGPGNRGASLRNQSTLRMSTITSGASTSVSNEVITPEDMDELAELTDYCKAQYAACMDNYCNVLDDNQGRCSCSANIKNYAKAEAALKAATEELQEVAQKIQYIGLSAREVETLFTQTEAELKMQSTTDTSQLKTSLDKIKDMIIDVQSGNATSNSTSGLAFDLSGLLDFTIDSTGFDLTAFLGGFGTSGNTINNQRGAELFKTATNRCKANVLKSCTAQGVDASLVTNAYDLEIDKECIIYERNLNDSNDQMVATVRNAKSVLQKARLLVEQSKNEYDMRGCINALDSCMQDEYVCGSDYEKCLDPSGRYIVNGEVVIGTDPGRAVNGVSDGATGVLDGNICSMNLYNVWNYGNSTPGQTETSNCKNAWNSYSLQSGNGNLSDYIKETLGEHDGLGMSQFIQNKIGWNEKDKNYGMCMSVLNKCQDFTYTGNGTSRKYNPKNEVVKQYLDRILIQIKAKQDEILTEHAESCITDVTTCLSQNNYPFDEVADNVVAANIAINACRSTIVTCMSVNGYSVDNPTPTDLSSWICGITTGSPDCIASGGGDGQTYTYTVTYNCNKANVTNNTTWSKSASGSSTSVSMTFDSSSTVTSKCNYSGFNPRGYRCTYTSSGSTFSVNLGASRNITGNATCNVEWQADSGNTTCSAGNLSYCTTEEACTASNVGGTWCYASTTATSPSCRKATQCACNANDLSRCTTGDSCKGLGSNYDYCTSNGTTAICAFNSSARSSCCFGSTDNCDTKDKCEKVGNCWNNNTGVCSIRSIGTSCPEIVDPDHPADFANYNGVLNLTSENTADGASAGQN